MICHSDFVWRIISCEEGKSQDAQKIISQEEKMFRENVNINEWKKSYNEIKNILKFNIY